MNSANNKLEIIIRKNRERDQEKILKLWYDVSLIAHPFIPASFWAEHIDILKNKYLPSSETYVAEHNGEIAGFISLIGNYIGALFIAEAYQGHGIGTKLVYFCQRLKGSLYVDVYKDNINAREFYQDQGFIAKKEKLQEETGCYVITMISSSKV